MSSFLSSEVLFRDDPMRKSILPIKYKEIWTLYKKLQSSTWTREEIDFKTDLAQIANGEISPEIMKVVSYVLGFFSGADTIVNENLAENFLRIIKIMEALFFYGQQIQNENVHNETYSFMIDIFYKDNPEKKAQIFNAIKTMPCVRKLFDWCNKWIRRTPKKEKEENPILQKYIQQGIDVDELAYIWCTAKILVAFACVEGIMFSAAFCIIFWIKEQGLLPGFTFSNELISTDEGLHRDFACLMYSMIHNKPPEDQIKSIIREAVSFKKEFVDEMLSVPLTGMNKKLMNQYVKYTADSLCTALNYSKIYSVSNPFPFMEKISINGQTNFFERRVGEYSLGGFEDQDSEDNDLELDDDY
jgi:ribonucleoside-diphosphate reductase beta chain